MASLSRSPHYLDWANMPDPFRHYEGVPVLDLPADPPLLVTPYTDSAAFLSALLFHSAAISASKLVPSTGSRYALRVNPSSGNLHPTEFHFLTRGLRTWPDGLYHYRVSSHMAEQRARGDVYGGPAPLVFILTTIAWREAWKYRDRAYRYCLHDIGHAWQSLALAADAMGCTTHATADFNDDEISTRLRLPPDEWPMLMIEVRGDAIPVRAPDENSVTWYGGEWNALSHETIEYPLIDEIHRATKPIHSGPVTPVKAGSGSIALPAPAEWRRGFAEAVRTRRSALDFLGGPRSITLAQLSAVLRAAFAPTRFIQLYLYVHRVEGLPAGVYRFWPEPPSLELITLGDQRVAAAGLSLGQDLAGNACVAFSMIADFERATQAHGDRGYRYVHFEAGAMGQRLYVAAEALGLGATGMGAFYDDQVHRYLGLTPDQGQVVYHFAIGYPVPDPRLDASSSIR